MSPDQPLLVDDEYAPLVRRLERHKRERWLAIVAAAAIGLISTAAGLNNELSDDHRVGDALLWIASVLPMGPHDFISIGFALLANSLVNGAIAWAILAAAHRVFRSSDVEALRRAGF